MNIKKYAAKALSFLLCIAFALNIFMLVNATEFNVTEKKYEDIEVIYNASSTYSVIIPKTIVLDTNRQSSYSIQVRGDIASNQRVYVSPIDGIDDTETLDFYMKEQAEGSKKADVIADISQSKFYWNSVEVKNAYEETNNSVSAPDLTAGAWKGTFQVEINLQTEKEHEHTYVDGVCTGCGAEEPDALHEHKYIDGKCECGEIDPNHEHNYEDGTCTICGKETDPYETAPAEAYSNWNYTLDDENDIITLNYYTGSETDVIVYANYVIGEKSYKTQFKNNSYDKSDINAGAKTNYMFNGSAESNCKNITSIKFSKNIDTSNMTDMGYMFNYCSRLTSLDLSSFDTSNVTNMDSMFSWCGALSEIDLSSFNTSKVTDMHSMFHYCSSLRSLDLSNFDTSNVTDMSSMFYNCGTTKLDLDLSNFDTSNVTSMYGMFNQSNLRSVNLSSFDTSNVTNMSNMFSYCSYLQNIDLTSFDTSNVTKMNDMFRSTSKVSAIYVTRGKWSTSKATTTGMFTNSNVSSVTYK